MTWCAIWSRCVVHELSFKDGHDVNVDSRALDVVCFCCSSPVKGDVSETVRMFFDESKSFPPAAKSLLTIQEVDASLTRLSQLTREDEQQNELEDIAKK